MSESIRPWYELGFTLATSRLPCLYAYQEAAKTPRGGTSSDEALVGVLEHTLALRTNEYLIDRRSQPGQAGRSQDPGAVRNFSQKILGEAGLNPKSDLGKYFIGLALQFEKHYKLPQEEGTWLVESRLAIDRNWQPCEVGAPKDTVAGTLDLGLIDKLQLNGLVRDYKFGNRHVKKGAALISRQLKTYCWLLFCHNPTLRVIKGTLDCYTMHGNSDDTADFYREPLCEEMEAFYGAKFALIDMAWEAYGGDPWPTYGMTDCCNYCTLRCPALELITGGEIECTVRAA